MENISDFFKDLRDRLSSPLFSSFVISWLIFNYKIVIGLVFYKIDQLELDGYCSYLDLIQKNNSLSKFLWLPLGGSLLYTFIFPILKNYILAFNAWNKRWGSDMNLKISKTGHIPVLTYLNLKEKYATLINNFVDINKNERQFQDENLELKKEIGSLSHEISNYVKQIDDNRMRTSKSKLIGSWVTTIFTNDKNKISKHEVTVNIAEDILTVGILNSSEFQIFEFLRVFTDDESWHYLILKGKASKALSYWRLSGNKDLNTLEGTNEVGVVMQLRRQAEL